MIILNVLEGIFNSIFPISIIISTIVGVKKSYSETTKDDTEKNVKDSNKDKWKENVKLLILFSTVIVFIAVFVIIVANIKKLYWLILFIGVPTYLQQITSAYQSFGIVEKVVKSNDNGKLSIREQAAIKVLAYSLWFFGIFQMFEKLIEFFTGISNIYLSDMLIVLTYIGIYYIYIFFICSLLPELIFYLIKLLKKIYELLPWKSKFKSWGDVLINKNDMPIPFHSTLIFQWEIIGKWKLSIRWIRYLLLPITFLLDIIIFFVHVMISFFGSSVVYVIVLTRMIMKTLNRISNCLLGISDKRVVAISFRIALVMALVCVVILNRYQTIFKIVDTNTAILEFVASAIIIPVIFEWINSVKSNQSHSKI